MLLLVLETGFRTVMFNLPKKTVTTHYPDYKEFYCNSPKQDNSLSSCTITRDFSVPVYISGGNGDMSMCGDNCVRIWFGRRDDNYWSDGVFDNELTLISMRMQNWPQQRLLTRSGMTTLR